jgi:hypothetical protein
VNVEVQRGSAGTPAILAGVIEGFYGKPWSRMERVELFDWMREWGLDTYLYAPKDDLKHRALWRVPYTADEAEELADLIRCSRERGLRFIYALSPGLDIRYARASELEALKGRVDQMFGLGCDDFCLLFDDIPERLEVEDSRKWGPLAGAQSAVTNELFRWVRQRGASGRFLFCPTPYCGRMADRELGGRGYLPTIGRDLLAEIDVLWTGPEIISREITVEQIRLVSGWLRRKPLIWDNLHANDYDGRRFYWGPYAGRAPELRSEVRGFLSNPNNEFALNYVPLRTLARFVQCNGNWDPRAAYLEAMGEWLGRFETVGEPIQLKDLILLGDCYYLPHQEGPEAEALFEQVRALLEADPAGWGAAAEGVRQEAGRLRALCVRLTQLRDRSLFHALSRRIWDLREELDLIDHYIGFRSDPGHARQPCHSDFHLPRTYRGGMVARLQRLLEQGTDGNFEPRVGWRGTNQREEGQ